MFRIAALIACLLVCASSASAQGRSGPLTLRVGVLDAEVAAEAFYASYNGFFTQAGLNVQFQTFNNGSLIATAVAGGSLDVGLADLVSVTSAHARGLPFVYIAPGLLATTKDPTMGVIVPAASPIRTAAEIDGKAMAVSGVRNIAQVAAEAWMDHNGGDAKTVKFVEIPFPTLLPALAQGRVQVAFASEPWLTLALDAGYRVIYLDERPLAPEFMQSGWLTTREWVRTHHEAAARFVAVMRETARWANAHPIQAGQILAKYTGIRLSVAQRMHKGTFSVGFRPELVQPVVDAAVEYGILDQPFPARELFEDVR